MINFSSSIQWRKHTPESILVQIWYGFRNDQFFRQKRLFDTHSWHSSSFEWWNPYVYSLYIDLFKNDKPQKMTYSPWIWENSNLIDVPLHENSHHPGTNTWWKGCDQSESLVQCINYHSRLKSDKSVRWSATPIASQ